MSDIVLLKVGSKYKAEHVNRLARLLPNERVLCFTDDPLGIECPTAPLPNIQDVQGWWWKLWIFSIQAGQLYLDLDVTPVKKIDRLMLAPGWWAIKDPWQSGFNTSTVKIGHGGKSLWKAFLDERPDKGRYARYGDQDFFTKHVECTEWPDGWCVSFKHYFLGINNPKGPSSKAPDNCKIIYYHGEPKPWDGGRIPV